MNDYPINEQLQLINIIDSSIDGMVVIDKEGNIRFTNHMGEKLFNKKKEDLIGTPFGIPVISKKHAELKIPGKDGSIRYVEMYLTDTLWEGEDVTLATLRDITEQKKTKEELKKKEEILIAQSRSAAMGEMIGMIAHQWRQPLSTISMAASNILVDIELGTTTENSMQKECTSIVEQTQYLSKTIDDFRNFLNPKKNQELTSICELMQTSIKMINKSLENNSITVDINADCKHDVFIYQNELLQVFLNILNNAKDVLKESKISVPLIKINIWEDEKSVKVSISDNGGGIPKEIFKSLGEPYVSSKVQSGTGLGIYMSKIIVEKHLHGSISWENIEKGACFTIMIPLKLKKEAK